MLIMISNNYEWLLVTCMLCKRINYMVVFFQLMENEENYSYWDTKKKQFHINQMQITKLFHAKMHNSCINEYSLRLWSKKKKTPWIKQLKASFTNCNMRLVIHLIMLKSIIHWDLLDRKSIFHTQQKKKNPYRNKLTE